MRAIMVSGQMLGWFGLLATVAVAGCTATPASRHSAAGQGRSASPAATTISPGAGSASAGPGGVRNLAVTPAVRTELTAAYVGNRGISGSDVAGTEPGSVYYAYDPATGTYWARATFVPSRTASFKVLVGFQDGASIGLFAKAGTGFWLVELGGEPLVCTEVRFFPRAVLTAWSLSADTAAFGCSSPSDRAAPAGPVLSQTYGVIISIPVSWRPTPYLGPEGFGYDGTSGWVQLNDMLEGPSGLHSACTAMATGSVLQPYGPHPHGLHPQINYRYIDGRPGCLILPSSDAARLPRRAVGPAFQASEALVEYVQPLLIPYGGYRYPLLVIDADPAHLVALADSVQLLR